MSTCFGSNHGLFGENSISTRNALLVEPHHTSTHKMCELASTDDKPQLSGLRLKVKIVRSSGKGWGCWFGLRRVIKAEGASRCDEFALHFRVAFSPGKRPPGNEINYLLIAEQDIRAKLTAQRKCPADSDLLSDKCVQYLIGGGSRTFWRRARMVTPSR